MKQGVYIYIILYIILPHLDRTDNRNRSPRLVASSLMEEGN